MLENTPSRRTQAWNSAAHRCASTVANSRYASQPCALRSQAYSAGLCGAIGGNCAPGHTTIG